MDDLIADFIAETSEGLVQLDNDLIDLEKDPNNQGLLGNIFRVMHTIKGTCGFLGMSRLEKVAHAGENVLGKIRDGECEATPNVISLVLNVIDVIKLIVEHIETNGEEPPGNDEAIIEKLNAVIGEDGGSHIGEGEQDIFGDGVIASGNLEGTYVEQAPMGITDAINEVTEPVKEVEQVAKPSVDIANDVEANKAGAAKGPSTQQSLRVNLDVLEQLMQQVGELVLTRNQLLQMVRKQEDSEFSSPLHRLNKITSELQEGVMQTRMQPIGSAWAQFPRLVRDLSIELDKKIELQMYGEETELDRQLLSTIKDPLTHMVRNSGDHGIETPEERLRNGKPEKGTITLRASHEGGHIIISISDDGRGINADKIKKKIIEKGLLDESEVDNLTDKQVFQYIFDAGFSTAEKITSVSGRGVGMDVVRSNIESIGGTVELNSIEGKGSTFLIKIPLTLAIMPVLIVQAEKQRFAIPQINVVELVKSGKHSGHLIEMINDSPVLRLRDALLPLVFLKKTMELSFDHAEESLEHLNGEKGVFIVVCRIGGYSFGLIVDMVFDTEEIVVKPVTPLLKDIDIYSGCTILGDGSVIMIIDANGVLRSIGSDNITSNDNEEHELLNEQKLMLLQFKTKSSAPKVVPLELVSRLEEMESSSIEISGGQKLIQYRGKLMKLISFDEESLDEANKTYEVIVFEDGDDVMGLVVEEILDIVSTEAIHGMDQSHEGFLQSIVINEVTCDLIDICYFFKRLFPSYGVEEQDPDPMGPLILLVDDSPFFKKFIPPSLAQAGYRVETASNGHEALERMDLGLKPDIVITDINMPIMSGIELVETCKENKDYMSIPFIALSSHSNEEVLSQENVKIIDKLSGYVTKTNHKALVEMISQVLNRD